MIKAIKDETQCIATTNLGERCKNAPTKGFALCRNHLRQWGLQELSDNLIDLARISFKAFIKRKRRWEANHPGENFPEPLPLNFHWIICGAKTRSGGLCKRHDIQINGRCRLHGGLSTGPKTVEGKKRSSQNFRKRTPWRGYISYKVRIRIFHSYASVVNCKNRPLSWQF